MGQRATSADIAINTVGEVLTERASAFVDRSRRLFGDLPRWVASARVKLTAFARPSAPWLAVAQANFTVGGQPIRAQVVAAFFQEIGRLLPTRLREHAARLCPFWPATRLVRIRQFPVLSPVRDDGQGTVGDRVGQAVLAARPASPRPRGRWT